MNEQDKQKALDTLKAHLPDAIIADDCLLIPCYAILDDVLTIEKTDRYDLYVFYGEYEGAVYWQIGETVKRSVLKRILEWIRYGF